ncbi:hypothetical protein CEXT_660831 [Caerostris extrusa]|uniref:Uncharacterized protein n=1 Tax=Caerostris extrusa TaxID=172846 RepID=A0AAV4SFW8_CAEEX|nr:hypothetical protein CEXT_660831 [Caerostris extrusa]
MVVTFNCASSNCFHENLLIIDMNIEFRRRLRVGLRGIAHVTVSIGILCDLANLPYLSVQVMEGALGLMVGWEGLMDIIDAIRLPPDPFPHNHVDILAPYPNQPQNPDNQLVEDHPHHE